MFAEFFKKDNFFDKYLELFINRYTIANLELEDEKTETTSPDRAIEMFNNMKALKNLIENSPAKISPYDLMDTADIINNGIYAHGFRKTMVEVKKAKHFIPLEAREIQYAIYSLFNAYHNIWSDLDIYEKEARLHMDLVRIQPFEDGNKRTARTITNFNLCNANKAPIIIGKNENEKYFEYIDNHDIDALAELFRNKSKEELEVMLNLYKKICGDSFSLETENDDVKIYIFARDRK